MSVLRTAVTLCVAAMVLEGADTYSQTSDVAPDASSIPFVATHSDTVQDMLWMADVDQEDVVFDLGSGDGRISIAAVRDFRARRAVGIEADPKLIRDSRKKAEDAGVAGRVEFVQGDLFKQDLRQATVIALFLGHDANIRLRPRLFNSLKPGSRIVSHQFGMGEWTPDKTLRVRTDVLGMVGTAQGPFTLNPRVPDYRGNERHFDTQDDRVHCWLVPEAVSGVWRGKTETKDGPKDCRIVLNQRLSKVTGTFHIAAEPTLSGTLDVELWGDHLRFSGRPRQVAFGAFELFFDGHVRENRMLGTLAVTEQGRKLESQWQAQRDRADLSGTWEWPDASGERTVKLRVERRDNTYTATYLAGRHSIPVSDFYDHGGGLYFTLLIGRERNGAFKLARDTGWLLGQGVVDNGHLKGRIEFCPSVGTPLDDSGETMPPRPITRDWSARRVESSAQPGREKAPQKDERKAE